MKLTVRRILANKNETCGILYVNVDPFCHTLEDEHRVVKVPGETRIPAGVYNVGVRPVNQGRVNARYLKRFPSMHRGMLWLQDVPGFTWIYIHMGNTDEHTSGCILVGQDSRIDDQGQITIGHSRAAYVALYRTVINAAEAGNLTIEVIDDENR